ncbi:gamma conglutin 1-like [Coffea arabica]|uniref:Gamma conglutin 1-like n=1 Tax=Coffea arabica TaxID=13443 RepID=A0A6P6VZ23_COFAR|nr:basic 7S globulin-like [Coffea arabica]
MASRFNFILAFSTLVSLLFASAPGAAQAPFNPNALYLPVLKDNATSLLVVDIYKRTPLKSIPLLVDLNGKFLSVNCEQDYLSSTYNAPICHSTQCSQVENHFCHTCLSQAKPGCHNNTCAVLATNPLTNTNVVSELAQDTLAIKTIEASNPGPLAVVRYFLFACTPSSFLQGPLPQNVQGIVGFGHNQVSLPRQLASHFGFPQKFALCLSSKTNQNGVIFLGNASYRIGDKDISQGMQYTPLTIGSQGEYQILVKSIRINHKPVQFNRPLLSRTRSFGGTVIGTTDPYTVLEHSIFENFTQFFTNEFTAIGASQVDPVSPFGVCFNKLPPPVPKVDIAAPIIDFVMENRDTAWSIFGSNSIVKARPGIWCLAFVDGGYKPRAPIVLGAYQLEDHIFEFDLASSQLGFRVTLKADYNTCDQFNFNPTP